MIGACPGCGIELPELDAPAHPYMTATPACWAGYGRLLAAQYADPERMRSHQLVVDAYAVQHPGEDDPRAVQSVGIHLMTLALILEHGADPAEGPRLHKRMVERPVFTRLEAPDDRGALTFAHVPLEGPAAEPVREWARSAWDAWAPHHGTVERWLRESDAV